MLNSFISIIQDTFSSSVKLRLTLNTNCVVLNKLDRPRTIEIQCKNLWDQVQQKSHKLFYIENWIIDQTHDGILNIKFISNLDRSVQLLIPCFRTNDLSQRFQKILQQLNFFLFAWLVLRLFFVLVTDPRFCFKNKKVSIQLFLFLLIYILNLKLLGPALFCSVFSNPVYQNYSFILLNLRYTRCPR